ncbi:DUF4124 domain-containing protein [Paraferrimonas sedimenticola]|uniref:DUF4124 domain-containing protein n=1 Tax=Paraferrimonas sedimenticola TaxID=375674 RepID=A0AA37RYI1_9GAMM|nr:DUF4124 domain-containing protein [Paraferrimonas sedimenticola]GLP97594.1 hypothetical protein GCM10007895_29010 [Paraferrimonas sedimenticola]
MRHLLVLFAVISFASSAAVYRWVDENGKVHYSDEPEKGVKAEQIEVKEASSISVSLPKVADVKEQQPQAEPIDYKLSIRSPNNEETIRNNNGNFEVHVDIAPKLSPSHRLALYLNGKAYSVPQRNGMFRLVNIDRGEHNLSAKLIDKNGKVLASSAETKVFLHRASVISRQGAG